MGLIGTTSGGTGSSTSSSGNNGGTGEEKKNMWECLQEFSLQKPTWGTCAGMILLAERCVGTSAVITEGQALIGGMDVLVCRNYFGSQVSSFEMDTAPPPPPSLGIDVAEEEAAASANPKPFPGIFIRAPAILEVGDGVEILGKVIATPCRQAAATLQQLDELEKKRNNHEKEVGDVGEEEKKDGAVPDNDGDHQKNSADSRSTGKTTSDAARRLVVPVATATPARVNDEGSTNNMNNAQREREVICAVRKNNLLCTAFHPELTDDLRWHAYFLRMVLRHKQKQQ